MKRDTTVRETERGRVAYFDNLKFILIILVVLGHLTDMLKSISVSMAVIRYWIYLFHMPLFIFMSGYFAVGKEFNIKKNYSKVFYFFSWYFIFKILIFLQERFMFDNLEAKLNLFRDGSLPWYIFSLAIWHLLLPYVLLLRRNVFLILMIIAGLVVGNMENIGDYMCLSRIIVYAPFFYAGVFCSREQINKIIQCKLSLKIFSGIILTLIFVLIYKYYPYFQKYILFESGRHSYQICGFGYSGNLVRLIFLIAAVFTGICFMCIIPRRKNVFSVLGRRTFQVYVLHSFIFYWFRHYSVAKNMALASNMNKVLLILGAITLTTLLSTGIFERFFEGIAKLIRITGKNLVKEKE